MLEDAIRNFYILTFAIYSFYKLLNISPTNKSIHLKLLLSSLLTSSISAVCFGEILSLNWIFILIIFFLIIHFFTKIHITTTYITVLFSFALSFITFNLCAIITGYILFPFYNKNYEVPWLLIRILAGSIHFFLIYSCFRIPRLQKGMKFLYHIPTNNIGATICIILFMFLIMFCQAKTNIESFTLKFTTVTLIPCFLLIYWWNYHLTQTYKKYTKRNEIASLNLLIEEQNQQINLLKSEHEKLERIIHKDNKLLPAISMAIIDSTKNKNDLFLTELATDSDLIGKLKQLYNERVETLSNYQKEIMSLPSTSFNTVNAVLSYMQSQALKENIQYQVILFDDLTTTIPREISENDFVHMLSDLLTNAINACRNIPSAAIQIYLGKFDNISTIKIYNTGHPFHIDTLNNLGQSRHTTHADTGGSGIGFMDIWQIKERYAATLLIDEITDTSSSQSTVCINILFNHKNHYIIQSDRHKELSSYINRPDIMIFSKD